MCSVLRTISLIGFINLLIVGIATPHFTAIDEQQSISVFGGACANQAPLNMCGAERVDCGGAHPGSGNCDQAHAGSTCVNFQAEGSGNAPACLPSDGSDCYMVPGSEATCTPTTVCHCKWGIVGGYKCRKDAPAPNENMKSVGTPHGSECGGA
jgi:hypothetical protein